MEKLFLHEYALNIFCCFYTDGFIATTKTTINFYTRKLNFIQYYPIDRDFCHRDKE